MTSIETKFRKLTEIEHCLARPGRYIGSIVPHTATTWVFDLETKKMVNREVVYVPAFLKLFDEVISNSVDFSKTVEGSHVSQIQVFFDKTSGEIRVWDDGGIVVEKNKDHDEYVPDLVFSLRAGSNFNDDDEDADNSTGTGQNGEGAALTAIFSKRFTVETCDGNLNFKQTRTDNSTKKTEPQIRHTSSHFTNISYVPDYERFGMAGLDDDTIAMLVKRTVDIAGCNPNLKIFVNSKRINIKDFSDYIGLYTTEFVYEANEHWKIGIAPSDGFEHISFVNTTMTKIGGIHVEYIKNQICNKLREFFKRRHKVEIKPSELSNHFCLFIDATIMRPRYDSQTKDNMITELSSFGTRIELSDKFITKITKTPIVQAVLDWIEAKKQAEDLKKLRDLNKQTGKADPRKVEKFADAVERKERSKCVVFLTEGDSAAKSVIAGRGKNPYIASFPLKGKPLNVRDREVKRIADNEEIAKILTIMGLQVGAPIKTTEIPDGEWLMIEIDGKEMLVNQHDVIEIDGKKINVSDLIK